MASLGDSLDESRPASGISQRLAHLFDGRVDALVEIHDGPGVPHPLAQLLAGDDALRVVQQSQEQPQWLVLQTGDRVTLPQFGGGRIQLESGKTVNAIRHEVIRVQHLLIRNPQGTQKSRPTVNYLPRRVKPDRKLLILWGQNRSLGFHEYFIANELISRTGFPYTCDPHADFESEPARMFRHLSQRRCLYAAAGLLALSLAGCGGGGGDDGPDPQPTLSSIAVTPAGPSATMLTSTTQFTATGTYSDGSTLNITSTVTWGSSATTVATITGAGVATSVGGGTTTISATSGSVNGSTVFTVTPAMLTWDQAGWDTVYWQ